jgi:PAS domain S-box-containing protein
MDIFEGAFMTDQTPWHVVLIDDEEDIREVMSIALRDEGYRVETAPDGLRGIETCQASSPQIVITDIRMPGMSGIQVLEAVKKIDPNIEVIVFTAFAEMDLAIQALQLDASDFITKPINDDALHLALNRAKQRYTSRKRLQDYTALLESEKTKTLQELMDVFSYQKNLIESSMDGILGLDRDDRIVTFNKSMESILGFSREAALGKMTIDDIFPADSARRLKNALMGEHYGGKDRLFFYEASLVDSWKKKIPVQISATTLYKDDRFDGWVCFIRDLREIRRLEREVTDQAQILHQDKMMSLGRLAASVVHEINNPLAGILNYSRLMVRILRKGALSEERREKFIQYLTLVENETARCSQIVSSLLAFSRKSEPAFEVLNIHDLVERCISLSRHKLELQHIHLHIAIQENLPPLEGDLNQLQQCLINIIFNAMDAMPQGGELYIDGYLMGDGSAVSISVKDTGTGISKEDLPYIFEPFYTTKQEGFGVGLGLSTVFGIIERHRGTIDVDSRESGGTTFTIKLPVSKTPGAGNALKGKT